MKYEQNAMQMEARERMIWTAPVLKKGTVESQTAESPIGSAFDGILIS